MNNTDISIDDLIEQKIARALENIPKIDTVATTYGSINADDLIAACKRLKKTKPSYNDLLRENRKLNDKLTKQLFENTQIDINLTKFKEYLKLMKDDTSYISINYLLLKMKSFNL